VGSRDNSTQVRDDLAAELADVRCAVAADQHGARAALDTQVKSSLGDAKSSLDDIKSSLDDVKSSLGSR
jgi:hypothetical protein